MRLAGKSFQPFFFDDTRVVPLPVSEEEAETEETDEEKIIRQLRKVREADQKEKPPN